MSTIGTTLRGYVAAYKTALQTAATSWLTTNQASLVSAMTQEAKSGHTTYLVDFTPSLPQGADIQDWVEALRTVLATQDLVLSEAPNRIVVKDNSSYGVPYGTGYRMISWK